MAECLLVERPLKRTTERRDNSSVGNKPEDTGGDPNPTSECCIYQPKRSICYSAWPLMGSTRNTAVGSHQPESWSPEAEDLLS